MKNINTLVKDIRIIEDMKNNNKINDKAFDIAVNALIDSFFKEVEEGRRLIINDIIYIDCYIKTINQLVLGGYMYIYANNREYEFYRTDYDSDDNSILLRLSYD